MTGWELAGSLIGSGLAGGLVTWWGRTRIAKWKLGVEHRKALNAAEAEENRHEESVIAMLTAQVERLELRHDQDRRDAASARDALQMKIDHATSIAHQQESRIEGLTERLKATERELESAQRRSEVLETENMSLRGQVASLTGQVSSLRLELAKHGLQCPEHLGVTP